MSKTKIKGKTISFRLDLKDDEAFRMMGNLHQLSPGDLARILVLAGLRHYGYKVEGEEEKLCTL